MLDLYENGKRVAFIPFSEVLRAFGVRRFWLIQNILGRKIVFVRSDSTVDSTLRADGGRVGGKHHSTTAPEPNQTAAAGGKESKVHPAKAKDSLAGAPPGGRARTHA